MRVENYPQSKKVTGLYVPKREATRTYPVQTRGVKIGDRGSPTSAD